MSEREAQCRSRAPIAYLDPGWLYLLAGLALLGATVLIPALEELAQVRHERDRALALERHRLARLERYEGYAEAVRREDPSLVIALAAAQLNQIPDNRTLVIEPLDQARGATVFAGLEPPPLVLPDRPRVDSILQRWTTSDSARPWLIAAGAVCLLVGLLPPSRGWSADPQR
ncbi:MAG: hypothetical protein JNM80_14595 [Phycisphaerae bacterium]|nr:hypothetical protein [Phycisphaerae bacterium]